MKRFMCELCGSTDVIKDKGVFVCQGCGCKYSLEEARKMMTEDDVNIQRTVRVDHSMEAEKILKNAYDTFCDGNYSEAFSLYSKVLDINPDNPHAIIYRALSSGWQSSVRNCNINEISRASKRAFRLKHDQVGDSEEYFTFVTDAGTRIVLCLNGIADMYINFYNKAMPKNYTITGRVATADIASEVKKEMENGVLNCCRITQNIAISAMDEVKDYTMSTDGYWTVLEALVKNAKVYSDNARLGAEYGISKTLNEIRELKEKASEQREQYQDKKKEAYFKDHPRERIALETERDRLVEKQKWLSEQIRTLEEKAEKVPSKDTYDHLSSLLETKENELRCLGMLQIREGKILQMEVAKLQKEKEEAWNAYQEEASAVRKRTKPLYIAKRKNESRLEEIANKLPKN